MNLRPYQVEAIDAVDEGWWHHRTQLIVLPTGAGKTVVFSTIAAQNIGKTLILVHREELLQQAADKLHAVTGIVAGIERGRHRGGSGCEVVISTIQSMDRRMKRFLPDEFSLIICDEAHHILAAQWRRVLAHFSGCAKVLGVTATPDRGDKKGLGEFFESIAYEASLKDLIEMGYLSRIRAMRLDLGVDISRISSRFGDLCDDEVANALLPVLRGLAKSITRVASERKTLLFLPRIDISQKLSEMLAEEGIESRHVSGVSDDRKEILKWYASPGPKALCNSMLLTEGYDEPSIDAICCLRPTKSRALYSQIVGRGTRPYPGKDHLLIIDPLWVGEKHALVKAASLAGENVNPDKVANLMYLGEELFQAVESEKADTAAEKLKEELARIAKGKIDESVYCPVEPPRKPGAWKDDPPTESQLKYLLRLGVATEHITTKSQAGAMIGRMIGRREVSYSFKK